MALTRKDLNEIGVPDEFHSMIIAKHRDTVDEIKDERDRYKTEAEKIATLQAECDNWKAKAEDNTAAARIAELENQIQSHKEMELNRKKQDFKALLESSGFEKRSIPLIMASIDFGEIETDENGGFKDSEKLIDEKKAEFSEYVVVEGSHTAAPATPPATQKSVSEPTSLKEALMQKYQE